MAYFLSDYISRPSKDEYQPDKKDYRLARRLQTQNPYVGSGQVFSVDGREFISKRSERYDPYDMRSGNTKTEFARYFREAPTAAPAPKPAPAASKPKKAAPPPPTKQDSFSKAAAALLKTAEATLASANKPTEKMKIINSQSVGVDAAPLQIGPAAPPSKTSGVDSFKRKKPTTNAMKILTANALNI